jgi:hypothetical protein
MNCKGALSLQLLLSLSLKALRQKEVRVKWPQEEDRLDCCCFTICTWIWLVFIKIICLYKAVIKFWGLLQAVFEVWGNCWFLKYFLFKSKLI